jgi:hypothetical protein
MFRLKLASPYTISRLHVDVLQQIKQHWRSYRSAVANSVRTATRRAYVEYAFDEDGNRLTDEEKAEGNIKGNIVKGDMQLLMCVLMFPILQPSHICIWLQPLYTGILQSLHHLRDYNVKLIAYGERLLPSRY